MNPLTDLPQFLMGNHRKCSLFGFEILTWVGPLVYGKTAKIVIYEHARVNGGISYEYPGKHWVSRLVLYKPGVFSPD